MNLYHCGGLVSGRIATAELNLSKEAFLTSWGRASHLLHD